ncbi:hypothetical protein QP336_26330, partial [Escherichia coli]|nr:hypothetical protein [Escherichia coli]
LTAKSVQEQENVAELFLKHQELSFATRLNPSPLLAPSIGSKLIPLHDGWRPKKLKNIRETRID